MPRVNIITTLIGSWGLGSCLCLLQAENEEDLERFINQRLWRIAREKLKISHTSDEASPNPDVSDIYCTII